MTKALQPPSLNFPHQPTPPRFVQTCPICGHPVGARTELRTHEDMLEHWIFAHDATRIMEMVSR